MSQLLTKGSRPFTRRDDTVTATIAASGTISTAVDLSDSITWGIVLPATFTGTTLTFQVSADDSTYQALTDSYGVAVSMTVAQGKSYTLPQELTPWPFVKFVSGSTEGTTRTITIVRKR